ncbi:hypothetical protein [Ramlibacter albus]|uniref:Uncharacterized protein n=1 Tax=Ramlibacter albus TaxID=2079448 RepID=A0A923MFR3_9BURK|nr:hypothetical protein [Ramlibacter albus]MBC5768434.1 hypothetical protein [Ramlibacter albus]
MDTWMRLPGASVCVPLTVSVVSVVRKSPGVPVSSLMPVMLTVSALPGGVMSIVTARWSLCCTAVPSTTCTK